MKIDRLLALLAVALLGGCSGSHVAKPPVTPPASAAVGGPGGTGGTGVAAAASEPGAATPSTSERAKHAARGRSGTDRPRSGRASVAADGHADHGAVAGRSDSRAPAAGHSLRDDGPTMPAAIRPSCATDGYDRQEAATPNRAGKPKAWTLNYMKSGPAPTLSRHPKPTGSFITITEEPPGRTFPPVPKGRTETMGGHEVVFVQPDASQEAYAVEWTTSAASYVVVASGITRDTLSRLVGCLA